MRKDKFGLKFHKTPFHVTHDSDTADRMAASEDLMIMGEIEFDAFLLECSHVTWPNEELSRICNVFISGIDPSLFEKRIVEMERKRQLLYVLPDEFAVEHFRQSYEHSRLEEMRIAGLTGEEKFKAFDELITWGIESGNAGILNIEEIKLEARKQAGLIPFDNDEDKIKLLKSSIDLVVERVKFDMLRERFKRAEQQERDGTLTDGPTFFKELESGKYDDITLDNESFDAFVEACENSKEPSEKLKKAVKESKIQDDKTKRKTGKQD